MKGLKNNVIMVNWKKKKNFCYLLLIDFLIYIGIYNLSIVRLVFKL